MSTKGITVVILILLLCFLIRFFLSLPQSKSGQVNLSGTVSSEPYLRGNDLNFRVDNYFVKSSYQNIQYGDKLEVKGNLSNNSVNATEIKILEPNPIEKLSREVRTKLANNVRKLLPEPEASLLNGILLGIKTNLPKDFQEALIDTGTIHVIVVSGYNITLIAGLFLALSSFLGRKKAAFLAVLGIFFYSLLVGFQPPTLRALIMGSISILAVIVGRQNTALYVLLLAGWIMLMLNPSNLVDISFQLSFAATLGVILFSGKFSRFFSKLPKWFSESLATTIAAQVLVLPIIVFYFGRVSASAPLVNSLILWTVPVSTILGMLLVFLTFVSAFTAQFIAYIIFLPLTLFVFVVKIFSNLGYLNLQLSTNNVWVTFGLYLFALALLLQLYKPSKKE